MVSPTSTVLRVASTALAFLLACEVQDDGTTVGDDGTAAGDTEAADNAQSAGDEASSATSTDAGTLPDGGTSQGESESSCAQFGERETCALPDGDNGVRFCDTIPDELQWGACLDKLECEPGESGVCGSCGEDDACEEGEWQCVLANGVPSEDTTGCP